MIETTGSFKTVIAIRNSMRVGYTDGCFAYGELRSESVSTIIDTEGSFDPYGQATTIVSTTPADMGYAGYYLHSRSGLNLTRTRAYSASLGRFISRDPIGEAGGVDLYAYVNNNPVNFSDRNGTDAVGAAWGAAIGAGIGGLAGGSGGTIALPGGGTIAGAEGGAALGGGVGTVVGSAVPGQQIANNISNAASAIGQAVNQLGKQIGSWVGSHIGGGSRTPCTDKFNDDMKRCNRNRCNDLANGMSEGEAEVYYNWCKWRAEADYEMCLLGFK